MADAFFYGVLCHPPLRAAILERHLEVSPANLSNHAVFVASDDGPPDLIALRGAAVDGALARGLSDDDLARLDYYAAVFGGRRQEVEVATPGACPALHWRTDGQVVTTGLPWVLQDWAARWGALATATARDVMALRGDMPPEAVAARLGAMRVRGASRLRAVGAPARLRRAMAEGDVAIAHRAQPYARYFAVEEYDLSFRRFDGSHSATVNRAVFISGDAVTVLPYDPARDRVLLVEQFRAGPFARGDDQPWQLEPVAGRIDPGETPEDAARREAVEEAGLTLGALLPVAAYYPTPAAKAEFLYSYVALTDLPDGCAGTFGLADEAEDIRGHLVSFDQLMQLVESGEIANAPLILTAFWLARERTRLRA